MKHFTYESLNPSEKTLEIIKQIAHSCRSVKLKDGSRIMFCVN